MLLGELLLDVRSQIDGVSNSEVIVAVNSFVGMQRVWRQCRFEFRVGGSHEAHQDSHEVHEGLAVARNSPTGFLTAVSSDVDYGVSWFDYDSGVVRFEVQGLRFESGGFCFDLPSAVVHVGRMWLSTTPTPSLLKGNNGTSTTPAPSLLKGNSEVVVRESRVVEVTSPQLSPTGLTSPLPSPTGEGVVMGECLIVLPPLPFTMAESLSLPFPEHWYPALRAWVFKELYLSRMARSVGNGDLFVQYRGLAGHYERDYHLLKVKKLIPVKVAREGCISL